MSYESLFRLYRKSPAVWEEVYRARCGSPFTKHLGIRIKEYNRSNGYDGFFCYCEDIDQSPPEECSAAFFAERRNRS